MKRLTLILVLVVLISLALVTPVLAGGDDCKHPLNYGYMLGPAVRNEHAYGKGYFQGSWWGHYQACHAATPKTPYWINY